MCFQNVSCSITKLTTHFGVLPFFLGKVKVSVGHESKTHILLTKINEQFAKVSPSDNNYSFRTIQQQQQQLLLLLLQLQQERYWSESLHRLWTHNLNKKRKNDENEKR